MFVINAFCNCILRQCLKYIYTLCTPFYWPLHLFNRWPPGVAVSKITPFHLPWFHAAQRLYSGCWLFVTVWMVFRSVSVCLHVWVNERVSECLKWACLCVFFWKKKNLHSDLIWSDQNLALLWSEMIGNSLASLHGVEQPSQQTTGPPHFMLWSEVMNWSDILVPCGFGFISNLTVDSEYRGDSDLTTTKVYLRPLTLLFVRSLASFVFSGSSNIFIFRFCEIIKKTLPRGAVHKNNTQRTTIRVEWLKGISCICSSLL